MVLSGLALSILGLFRFVRQATTSVQRQTASTSPLSPNMEVISLREDDRAMGLQNPGVEPRGLEIQERETHFMSSARAQGLVVSRSTSSKRKLDDYEIGMAESSVSTTSQVRARRESREDVLEESVAESSGRERSDALVGAAAEAQPLDGESQMREEDGNAAIDDDSEDSCYGTSLDGSSKEPPDKAIEPTITDGELLDSPPGSEVAEVVDTEIEPGSRVDDDDDDDDEDDDDIEVVDREPAPDETLPKEPVERDLIMEVYDELLRSGSVPRLLGSSSGSSISTSTIASEHSATPMEMTTTPPARLQFFVRTYERTIVLCADASDLVESVHQQIFAKTGLPVAEQRLIFGRLQLQQDQTLASCNVDNDATLTLVARMRSTAHPSSWQLINDLVSTIRSMCATSAGEQQVGLKLMHSQDCVRASVQEFLKMAAKSLPVPEHMQVFEQAGATAALIMLLLSPLESNRECAEDAINMFLASNDEYLPANIHCHCAPLLLEFCKLLAKSAPNHALYASCRQALARLLDSVLEAHGSPYFNEAKADSIVEDFAPFVNELSSRLTQNLRFTAKAYSSKEPVSFSSYAKEAKDFTAFVIPLCKAMEVCKGVDTSGSSGSSVVLVPTVVPSEALNSSDLARGTDSPQPEYDYTKNVAAGVGAEIGSHGWLRQLFKDLLHEIDSCLEAVGLVVERQMEAAGGGPGVGNATEERPFGWAPFLMVLKGLHAVAKLYEGAMVDLLDMLMFRRVALNILIRQSRWQDDDFWLLDHPPLLDFESKRRLVMAMLPEPQDDHDERIEIVVKRAQLLTESFERLAYVEPDVLQGGISVEFAAEEATGPGVLREWFSMICREIFNPQNALFLACPNDRRRFFPNPASGVNPGHLTYFRFCGRVIALALMHRVQMDVVFALSFFKQLAGLPVLWEDAKDADPCLFDSCKKILDMDPELIDADVLGLTFVSEVEELGSHKSMELCSGGKDMVVTSENRRQFVELLVQRRLVASVAEQVKSFSQGFSELLVNRTHEQFLRALEPEDLDLMLYGKDRNICLEDWKSHTEYHDFSATDDHIVWFWQVVENMSADQQRRLLYFSTSVTHLPAEGFAGLSSKFHIHRAHTEITWLPTAHTCFYQLVLPAYPTYEIMSARLLAITECHIAEGFGFA